MKISRIAREKYGLDEDFFESRGNIKFDGDVHSVRKIVQNFNQKRDLINFPEMAVKTSDLYAMGLLTGVKEYLFDLYLEQNEKTSFKADLYQHLESKFSPEQLRTTTLTLIEDFPPNEVFQNQINSEEFLSQETDGVRNEVGFVNEFINLWLMNSNPAFSSYGELFEDAKLEKQTEYLAIVDEIRDYMEDLPKFSPTNENILDVLTAPETVAPHSVRKQLEYIRDNWGTFLGKYTYLLLTALDLIQEEEKMRGFGPGKPATFDFDGLERENYTQDKDWMPNVIMMAKNSYVWLDQLSRKYDRGITHLDHIPDEELEILADWGCTALWLIGLWERSPASKTIKKWCGNDDAVASAYSLFDYKIADDLGGDPAYENLRDRAKRRGIRLASDMVPNHSGIDSKWIREHPDWFLSLPHPAFPSYQYTGADLCGDPNIGVYLEDKYFTHQDAAVTFKRVDFRTGETRFIYHGNDGTNMPWNDTAQLNYLMSEVREAVIQKIINVAKQFPIIRFDAAMTLARKHVQRLWFPEPGSGGDIPSRAGQGLTKEEFIKLMPEEFWREVVERIKQEVPDTLLLAEAFWMLEGFFVRTLGMHRVYNSIFMHALRDENNSLFRDSLKKALEFDRRMLKRFVNFMNNPDEETAANQFGTGDKYFGVALMLVTLPGLPMIGHGQIEGFREKYGMEFRRAYLDEKVDEGLLHHHERTIFPIMKKRYIFSESDYFTLYDFWKTSDGNVNEDVFAYSNMAGSERGLVIYHNKYRETRGWIKVSCGYNEGGEIKQKSLADALSLPREGFSIFKDLMAGLEYLQRNDKIQDEGLYFELGAFQGKCFTEWQVVEDGPMQHYAQLYEMLNGNGVHSIDDTLNEMVYKPILTPFRELYSGGLIQSLFVERDPKIDEQGIIQSNLKELFKETQKLCKGEVEYSGIIAEVEREIKAVTNLHKMGSIDGLDVNTQKLITGLLPQDPTEWGTCYGWVLIHFLGKLTGQEDYSLVSRSWIDDWRLSNILKWVLGELGEGDEDSLSESIYLIKLLTAHQEWHNHSEEGEFTSKLLALKKLLSDPEVQTFLGFNRYHNILWYDGNRFQILTRFLALTAIIQSNSQNLAESIKVPLGYFSRWKEAHAQSEFQVEKLLNYLK